jgi:hypothetical protein
MIMDIPDDPQERKNKMVKILQDYGKECLDFEPEDQPNVFTAFYQGRFYVPQANLTPFGPFSQKVYDFPHDRTRGRCQW